MLQYQACRVGGAWVDKPEPFSEGWKWCLVIRKMHETLNISNQKILPLKIPT